MSRELDKELYNALKGNSSVEHIQCILEAGANPRSIDYMDMVDFPHMIERSLHTHPCGFAMDIASKIFPQMLEVLTKAGFDVNERFFYRQSGQLSFVEYSLIECVEKIIKFTPNQQTFDEVYLPNIKYLLKTSLQQQGDTSTCKLSITLYSILINTVTKGGIIREDIDRGWKLDNFIKFLEILNGHKEFVDWQWKGVRGLTPVHLLTFIQTKYHSEALMKHSAGENLELKDIFGLTPLHTSCVLGNVEMAKALLKLGANIQATTNLGWTPMDICRQGSYRFIVYNSSFVKVNKTLLELLSDDLHVPGKSISGGLIQDETLYKLYENELNALDNLLGNDVDGYKKLRGHSSNFVQNLLTSKEFGPLCCHRQETEIVYSQVHCVMKRLISVVVDLDPWFECELALTGSNAEGTKLHRPDEFDYNVILIKLSQCDIRRYCHPRHGEVCYTLNSKDTYSSYWHKFCFCDKGEMILNTVFLRTYFIDLLNQGLSKPEVWAGLNLYWRTSGTNEGQTLNLMWTGAEFPDMDISVDIMTFVKLSMWPENCLNPQCTQLVPHSLVESCPYIVQKKYFFVLTASRLELHVMQNLPLILKYAFVLCKSIMKLMKLKERQLPIPIAGQKDLLHEVIPSTYSLKNATFYVWSDFMSGQVHSLSDREKSIIQATSTEDMAHVCLAEHLENLKSEEIVAIQKFATLIMERTSFKYYRKVLLQGFNCNGWERYFFNPKQPHLYLRPSMLFNIGNIKKRDLFQYILQ